MNVTQSDLRTIQWRRSYDWAIRFLAEDTPKIFRSWFPATSIRENLWTVDSYDIRAGQSTYKIPKSTKLQDIEITFEEDQAVSITRWLENWVLNQIFLDGGGVQYLSKCCKPLIIARMDSMKQPIFHSTYMVYPEGSDFLSGGSESAGVSKSVTFIVAQVLERNAPSLA